MKEKQFMSFSEAMDALISGKALKVARDEWECKKMYVVYTKGNSYITGASIDEINPDWAEPVKERYKQAIQIHGANATVVNLPHIDMVTSTGEVCVGCNPSKTDLITNDWYIVEFGIS